MSERRTKDRSPRRAAAALRYRPAKDPAPKIVAVGRGPVAERIIALAREHGIPTRADHDLVEVLAELDLGQVIPVDVYEIVAEVLAYVYRLNSIAGRQSDS